MTTDRLVLLTGATGNIGVAFCDEYWSKYRSHYQLRLATHRSKIDDDRFEDVVKLDLGDVASCKAACEGVDTVIHMAAQANWEANFEDLLQPNVIGTTHLFEGARLAGVKRMIFASSVHAIMGYPVDVQVHAADPPRPDSLYGATKLYGEGLCSSYAYNHGMSCIAIRIGMFVPDSRQETLHHSTNPQALDIFVSQRDLSQLLHKCILAPREVDYAILNGLSDNRFKRMDIEEARRLVGYAPEDDGFKVSEAIGFGPEKKV
jgi:uronate dehydrogenase